MSPSKAGLDKLRKRPDFPRRRDLRKLSRRSVVPVLLRTDRPRIVTGLGSYARRAQLSGSKSFGTTEDEKQKAKIRATNGWTPDTPTDDPQSSAKPSMFCALPAEIRWRILDWTHEEMWIMHSNDADVAAALCKHVRHVSLTCSTFRQDMQEVLKNWQRRQEAYAAERDKLKTGADELISDLLRYAGLQRQHQIAAQPWVVTPRVRPRIPAMGTEVSRRQMKKELWLATHPEAAPEAWRNIISRVVRSCVDVPPDMIVCTERRHRAYDNLRTCVRRTGERRIRMHHLAVHGTVTAPKQEHDLAVGLKQQNMVARAQKQRRRRAQARQRRKSTRNGATDN